VSREIQAQVDGTDRLRKREEELNALLDRVEALLARGGDVRMEGDALVVSPLEAEERPESTAELERLIDERLPLVELSERPGWAGDRTAARKRQDERRPRPRYRIPCPTGSR
jgi:hypothetical protein